MRSITGSRSLFLQAIPYRSASPSWSRLPQALKRRRPTRLQEEVILVHWTTFRPLTLVTKLRRGALEPARGCVASVAARDALPKVPSARRVMAAARSRLALEAPESAAVRLRVRIRAANAPMLDPFNMAVEPFSLASCPFRAAALTAQAPEAEVVLRVSESIDGRSIEVACHFRQRRQRPASVPPVSLTTRHAS